MNALKAGSGTTRILAVHGIQGTAAAWLNVATAGQSPATFILPNLRGRADAPGGKCLQDYSLQAFASDLHQVVSDELGAAPFVLAGWSMGVSVILEYLRRTDAPRPCGLILLSGTPCLPLAPWFVHDGDRLLVEIAERERRLGLTQAADHQAVAWTWQAIRQSDHRPGLAAIDLPTLIIHGSDDQDSPIAHAHWLAEGIGGARLAIIDGAGHSLLSEHSAAVAEKIGNFISTLNK